MLPVMLFIGNGTKHIDRMAPLYRDKTGRRSVTSGDKYPHLPGPRHIDGRMVTILPIIYL